MGAEVDLGAWELPAVFGWLRDAGGVAEAEMLKTFNCGIGMIAVVAADRAGSSPAPRRGGRDGRGDRARGGRGGRALFGAPVRRRRVAVLISGGGSNLLALARDMAAPEHPAEVCLVLANWPEAGGWRGRRRWGCPW